MTSDCPPPQPDDGSFHQARAPWWRRLHGRHHKWARTETRAHNGVETVQNSYMDAGIQVAINILVQNLSPWGLGCKHPLSRVLHNLLVTYLLTEAHSGYDLPFQSHRVFPGIFGGAPRHEEHHQSGDVCFHQFFVYLDDLRGRGPRAVAPTATKGVGLTNPLTPTRPNSNKLEVASEPYASLMAVAGGVGGVGRTPMATGVPDERGNHAKLACTEPSMGPRSVPLNEIIRRTGRRAAAARRRS